MNKKNDFFFRVLSLMIIGESLIISKILVYNHVKNHNNYFLLILIA